MLESSSKLLYLLLLDSGAISDLMRSLPSSVLSSPTVWLLSSCTFTQGVLAPYFPIDSEVYCFTHVQERIVVYEVYSIDPNMDQVVREYGSWNQDRNISLHLSDLHLFERRRDLMGYTFQAETLSETPYVTIKTGGREGLRLGGLWGDIWHGMLEKMMNFSTNIVLSPDRQWGAPLENGSWNGIISRLMINQTQVGLASFTQTKSRMEVVDLSPALTEGMDRMFIKYPGRGISWTTFIEPFDIYLWVMILCFIILLTLSLLSTYVLGVEKKINTDNFSLTNSFITIWGSQIAQGSHLQPKTASTRIVFCTSFVLGVILLASYSAKLISFLAVIKTNVPFQTLEDVLHSEYQFGSVDGTAPLTNFINGPENSIFRKIGDNIIMKDKNNIVNTIEEGLEKAKREKYVFVWTADVIKSITDSSCDFLNIPIDLYSVSISLGWSRSVPHRHLIDYYLKKMLETGQLDRVRRVWLHATHEDCESGAGFSPMGLENMVSAFAMIFLLAFISVSILLGEILARKITK